MKELFFRALLRSMLILLNWRIAWKIGRSEQLDQLLSVGDAVIALGILGHGTIHAYHFKEAKLQPGGLSHEAPTLTVLFASAEMAVKTLISADLNRVLAAIQNRTILISGDYGKLIWFVSIVKAAVRHRQ